MVHPLAQFSAHFEEGQTLGLDGNDCACARVATVVGGMWMYSVLIQIRTSLLSLYVLARSSPDQTATLSMIASTRLCPRSQLW